MKKNQTKTKSPRKKQAFPTLETKAFSGKIVLVKKVLPSGEVIEVKDVKYDHPDYRQYEINKFKVGEIILSKITNKKRLRSLSQNNYMHLYFSLIGDSSGHTMMEIKNWAKGKHLTKGITEVYGSKVRDVKDTSKLNMSEMCEFMNIVADDTEVPLPDPEPFNLPLTFDEYRRLKEKQKVEYSQYKPKLDYEKNTSKTKKRTTDRKDPNSLPKKRVKKS